VTRLQRLILVGLLGVVLAFALRGAGTGVGLLVTHALLRRSVSEWFSVVVPLLGVVVGPLLVAFAVRRFGSGWRHVLAALGIALVIVLAQFVAWTTAALPAAPLLASLTPMPPNAVVPETDRRRPEVTYRTNADGFRGADFTPKAPGSRRVVVVGDSFVFGMGVEAPDALPSQLQQLLEELDVLNLGVPGAHLRTHADVVAAALERLDPDLVLVCVTSNDFEGWNPQERRVEPRALSAYSLLRFAVGERAAPYVRAALFGLGLTPAADEQMRIDELTRLVTLTRARGVLLAAFAFTPDDLARLSPLLPDARLFAMPALTPEWFIPGDGHPTPAGHAAFARFLAPHLRDFLDCPPGTVP